MPTPILRTATLYAMLIAAAGCGQRAPEAEQTPAPEAAERLVTYTEQREPCNHYTPFRTALFGDLHVHTAYSFDAAANSLETYPADANRFAKGEPIPFFPLDEEGNPTGTVQLSQPLDFVSVTDHGEFLGERALCRTEGSPSYDKPFCNDYRQSERQGMLMLGTIVNLEEPTRVAQICGDDGALCREYAKGPWQEMIAAAEAAYDRSSACRFTSLIGYEYTGTPGLSNIHRNVIFRNDKVPALPVSYVEAPRDHLLWQLLDAECHEDNGCSYVTIPHNSNLANGRMFALLQSGEHGHDHQTRSQEELRMHAQQRQRHEPVMEIFQHKGNSECINGLSTVLGEPDEHCEFESVRTFGERRQVIAIRLEEGKLVSEASEVVTDECGDGTGAGGMVGGGCVAETDFLRSNLLKGLRDEAELGVNSAKLGVIGSTDTHASTPGAVSESDWGGHVSKEATPEERLQPGLLTSGIVGNPGGLAGVWAVENSRDAIFEALQRREVFGTSGPRIEPRFFGGWEYGEDLCSAPDMLQQAYDQGVPMGADLDKRVEDARPVFIAHARADAAEGSAPLQQLQIVKGWIADDGAAHYKLHTIAGSPDNDAGVDLATGERFGSGDRELCAVFEDPDFDPTQPSFYYLRVLENPSPRWSLHDCLRIPEDQRPPVCGEDSQVPKVIQEMAWSSPIWYRSN